MNIAFVSRTIKCTYPNWGVPGLAVNLDERKFRALRHAGYRGPLRQHTRRKAS